MTFQKTYFKYFALTAIFALFGCNSSNNNNNDGSGSAGGNVEADIIVTNITRNPNIITTVDTYYSCDSTQAVLESDTSTENFAVANGKLTLWDSSSCTAEVFTGTSSDIIGTWSTADFDEDVPIPDSYRPADCPDSLSADSLGISSDPLANYSATVTVTSTKVTEVVSRQVCFGSLLAQSFADTSSGNTVTDSGCDYVVVKNQQSGLSIRYEESMSGNVITTKITSGNTSCSLDENIGLPGAGKPDCPTIWNNQQNFSSCIIGLGGAGLAKSAAPSFHHRRLRPF